MALYRNISVTFWTDRKIDDDFTPEEKYFFLYLLTNPHTNICGCYEIGMKQMSRETGYDVEKIKHLLTRLEKQHGVILFDKSTMEILVVNWSKYNWSTSDNLRKAVEKACENIKSGFFKKIMSDYIYNNININNNLLQYTVTDTVSAVDTAVDTATATVVTIPYKYGMDTVSEKNTKDEIQANIKNYTDNVELQDALNEFVKLRKALKHGLTERGLVLSLRKLDKLGKNDAEKVAIVNQSIERGWKAFFPIGDTQTKAPDNTADIDEYNNVINKFLY